MTGFQQTTLLLTAIWLALVVLRFRRSSLVLIGGLAGIGGFALLNLWAGNTTLEELGLVSYSSWLIMLGTSLAWLALMVAYSPLADRLAARWFARPPELKAFAAIQQSRGRLVTGVAAAWILGGFLEELVARGIALKAVMLWLTPWLGVLVAVCLAICITAAGAGLAHLYQGPRAAAIITQLSVLFGMLFVLSGYNLWSVIICHGLYDTIAFIRFALKKSRYADLQ